MGLITEAIQPRAYELIRDRIAAIVADELFQQAAINYDSELDASIFLERSTPFNQSELPAVNIMLADGNYTDESVNAQRGSYSYHIDVYAKASSIPGERGDQASAVRMQRIVGVIHAILSDKHYITLQFARPFIENTRVEGIIMANPKDTKDAANVIMGRITFVVRVPENVQDYPAITLAGYDTQVQIELSAQGFLYSGNNVTPAEPVCAGVDVLINSVDMATASSGSSFDITVVDTNGADPVVSIVGSVVTVLAGAADVTSQFNGVSTGVDTPPGQDISIAVVTSTPALVGTLVTNTSNNKGVLLPNITHTDSDGSPAVRAAQIPMICTPGASRVIAPLRYKLDQSRAVQTNDEYWHKTNGTFDYAYTSGSVTQMLDPTTPDKIFYDDSAVTGITQHLFRFVGHAGGYYQESDATYRDIDGNLSDKATEFTLVSGFYIIDRLTWCGWYGARGGSIALTAGLATYPISRNGFADYWMPPSKYFTGIIRTDVNLPLYNSSRPPFDIQLTLWSCTWDDTSATSAWFYNTGGYIGPAGITGARALSYIRVHIWGTDDSI